MQCYGSLWSQLLSVHEFFTSACMMELAGMELAYTHLVFQIPVVLASNLVAEWEDEGVFIVQTVWPMPP